jgi:hypothetical protein
MQAISRPYIILFLKMKELAEREDDVPKFEDFWIHRHPMRIIWQMIHDSMISGQISGAVNREKDVMGKLKESRFDEKTAITVHLDKSYVKYLQAAAKERGVSRSKMLALIAIKWLDARKTSRTPAISLMIEPPDRER